MNSNIWKDKSELPDTMKHIICIYQDRYETLCYFDGILYLDSNGFVIDNKFIKWCYLDNLLSQSTRVEKLEKALEYIKEELLDKKSTLTSIGGLWGYWIDEILKKINTITKGDNDE